MPASLRLSLIYIFSFVLIFACHLTSSAQNRELNKLKKIKDPDSAMVYANKLIAEARIKHDSTQEARILYLQSKIVYKTGDAEGALDYARQALKIASVKDTNTYANSATMAAYMLSKIGKDVEALTTAFKILRETDAYGWKRQNVYSLACISDLYRNVKNPTKALDYALQAANGALAIKDSALYIFSLSTLSNIYSDKQIRTKATMLNAIAEMETILAPPYLHFLSSFDKARYLNNLGRLYEIQHNRNAQSVFEQSLAISRKENYPELEKISLNELMTLSQDSSHYKDAIKYGEQAMAIQPASKTNITLQKNIYDNLSIAYKNLQDYNKALEYFKKSTLINDSITNVKKAKDAAELDKKYSADKKLIIASAQTQLLQQQRKFIIAIALMIAIASVLAYRWFIYKRKKEAAVLSQQHAQLEKLDALKTRFFANISHELRTPLTLIMGPANQLLNKQFDTEQQQESYIKTIVANSKKLLNIVNELLDLGKLESGKLTLKLRPVALAPFIKFLHQGFASAAEYKKIQYRLVCKIQEDTFVQLDQDKFEKIGNNLIGNAIKFTPAGHKIIIMATTNGSLMEFSVTNSGSAISADDLPYIFDRYYQGYRDKQPLEGGSGIGLAIAREFTELMGGTIAVNNTADGLVFKVCVPLVYVEQAEVEQPGIIENSEITIKPLIADKQLIMVVEDNKEMADYITSIIQPSYQFVTAYNGAEALSLLQTMPQRPNLIISDVMMPEVDGFTLLETLKSDAALCNIPVIMLTALSDTRNKLKALNIGVDDYITKPFISSELIARVTNLVNNAVARLDAAAQPAGMLEDDGILASSVLEKGTEVLQRSAADFLWLSELETLVRKHTGKIDLNLEMLSSDLAISERQLFRRIKAITGLTPNKYIRAIRLQIAREAIETGKYRTIAEISYAAGFETPAYFSKLFKEHYGREVSDLL